MREVARCKTGGGDPAGLWIPGLVANILSIFFGSGDLLWYHLECFGREQLRQEMAKVAELEAQVRVFTGVVALSSTPTWPRSFT